MTRPRRVPLSLNLRPEDKDELYRRAKREDHRYPAVLAATLLERALQGGGGATPTLAREIMEMIEVLADRLTDNETLPPEPRAIVAELDKMYSRLKKEVSA
jgi:hypothetical protein